MHNAFGLDRLSAPWVRHGICRIGVIPAMMLAVLGLAVACTPSVADPANSAADSTALVRDPVRLATVTVEFQVPEQDNPLLRNPVFRRFFDLPEQLPERRQLSAGSGVIVDAANGYVLTNHHVVENAAEVIVTLKDRRAFQARLVGSDRGTDIALLEIDGGNLTAARFADSDDLRVGDFVLAIGNPFGLGQTVTSGIVSALGRTGLVRGGYEDFIQTDASINPGNSGGALINSRGELIGINTAILAPTGSSIGIGFAVPSNIAYRVMEQLSAFGEVRRGRLGIAVQSVTPTLARTLGFDRGSGVIVTAVEPGSAAEEAGLQRGDVIVAVDDEAVATSGALRAIIGLLDLGEEVQLTVLRGGNRRIIAARVSEAPQD